MKHCYSLEGYGYRLRPIRISDADFILKIRMEDVQRNRFIHPVSGQISDQEIWLNKYFEREGDYYFVVENRVTSQPEGLIAFYNQKDNRAEWGRWVLKKGSLAAVESVWLLYRIAFEQVGLQELYCCTITENSTVVSFHNSTGEKIRCIHKNYFELNGNLYDAVEQYADRQLFYEKMATKMEKQAQMVYRRNLKIAVGTMEFHHIGIATKKIEKELPLYTLMGYRKEGNFFEDSKQGVRGIFLVAEGQPRLELLENLPESHTLDQQIKHGQKMYHMAYMVQEIDNAVKLLVENRAKLISPLKNSAYFGTRICFLMLRNMELIELVAEEADGSKNRYTGRN